MTDSRMALMSRGCALLNERCKKDVKHATGSGSMKTQIFSCSPSSVLRPSLSCHGYFRSSVAPALRLSSACSTIALLDAPWKLPHA